MNCIERMEAVYRGRETDRYPFVPSIYEHGAAVIESNPGAVAKSADLIAAAAIESWKRYQHDLVTVGIDIYNVEAEALGCEISYGSGKFIPGVVSHPLGDQDELDPSAVEIPRPGRDNRLQVLADAVGQVVDALGDRVWIFACLSGPFSQAVELRGFEQLIVDMIESPEAVHELLRKTTELTRRQMRRYAELGASASIFESWATLPLITPEIFAEYVVPGNREVVQMVKRDFDVPGPAMILGGDTARLSDFFIEIGTSVVAADYNTDFELMRRKLDGRQIIMRGCADPKMIERGDWDGVGQSVNTIAAKTRGMRNFVWGCGCVSYDTPAENLFRFRDLCLAAERSA